MHRAWLLWLPLVAACVPATVQRETPSLEGVDWVLGSLGGVAVARGGDAHLQFSAGQAGGSDGCNRFSGPYARDGNALRFGDLASTQMACPAPVMERATRFHAALAATREARIDGGVLVLLDIAGAPLATFAAGLASLADSAWDVTGYNNGRQAVVSVVAGSSLRLVFTADGRLAGSAGCNRFTASWSADGGSIAIGAPASTRMMCAAEGVMAQEAAFLAALPRAATLRMAGGRLELRDAGGALLVSARRAPDGDGP